MIFCRGGKLIALATVFTAVYMIVSPNLMRPFVKQVTGDDSFTIGHPTTCLSVMSAEAIMAIAGQFQKDPITVEIASAQKTIHTVEQLYYEVPRGQKGTALKILLRHYAPRLSIIFCNTKKQVDELSVELSAEGMNVLSLHGDMKQEHRTNVMKQYRSGAYPILIATDVAARGIDVDDVELVCNYDIPQDNEYYIHRIGRTADKAAIGCSKSKMPSFVKIERISYSSTGLSCI